MGGIKMSSLGKKYIMAVTGFILVGFVIGHMAGNLQMFLHPDWINEYAYKLKTLPYGLLWIVRLVLLAAVAAHIIAAVLLVLENRKARPESYDIKRHMAASFASRTMKYSGLILLAFIVFHILHFTTQTIHPEFKELHTELEGVGTMHHVFDKLAATGETEVHDVHSMVVLGFAGYPVFSPLVSAFYILAMGLLALHLSHGVSSMFQSLGLRNRIWRDRLDKIAVTVAVLLFIGFTSIPVAALLGFWKAASLH